MDESKTTQNQKTYQEIKMSLDELSEATFKMYTLWNLYRVIGEKTLFHVLDQSWDYIKMAESRLKKLITNER